MSLHHEPISALCELNRWSPMKRMKQIPNRSKTSPEERSTHTLFCRFFAPCDKSRKTHTQETRRLIVCVCVSIVVHHCKKGKEKMCNGGESPEWAPTQQQHPMDSCLSSHIHSMFYSVIKTLCLSGHTHNSVIVGAVLCVSEAVEDSKRHWRIHIEPHLRSN